MRFQAAAIFVVFVFSAMSALGQRIPVYQSNELWTVQNKQIDKSIAASDSIDGKSGATGLVLKCKDDLIEYSCTSGCRIPPCGEGRGFNKRNISSPDGIRERLISFLDALLEREGTTMVTLAARAGGTPNDALIGMKEGELDFTPALKRVVEGMYCFRLTRADNGAQTQTFTLDWDRERAGSGRAAVRGLTAGLYRLEKAAEGGCERDPETGFAWIAVVPADRLAAAQGTWNNTEQWATQAGKDGLAPETISLVRRAVLNDLSR